MAFRKTRSSKYRSKKVVGAAIVVLAVAVITVLELTNTTHLFHSPKAVSSKIPVTHTSKTVASANTSKSKPSAASSTSTTTSDTSTKSTGGTAPSTSTGSSAPQAPFGSFVSNHSPSLSNASGEQSTCITTPGATCTITFTNDSGVVKTLPAQTTDANGNTFWDWDLNTAGFTTGNWTIKAAATINGQTQSVTDKLPLTVKS